MLAVKSERLLPTNLGARALIAAQRTLEIISSVLMKGDALRYSLPCPLLKDQPVPTSPVSVWYCRYPKAFSPAKFIGSDPIFSNEVGHLRSLTANEMILGFFDAILLAGNGVAASRRIRASIFSDKSIQS